MSIGREDFKERKESRIDRYEARAASASRDAANAYRRSAAITDAIPMGQPILVGHHSERCHRSDLAKANRLMEKSVEADEKAAYYSDRAEAAANNTAISSDDPDAVEKLQAKLSKLQAEQERDKALNKYYRKNKTVKGFAGISDEEADRKDAELSEMREAIRRPVPSWQLSNRNAEINRLKKRIESLRMIDQMEHVETEFDGGTLITNETVNRVQILFAEKPGETIRSKLKSYGFRWSPSEGAWQAPRTPAYLRRAKQILGITDERSA